MRKFLCILTALMFVVIDSDVYAQSDAIYVFKKDGTINSFIREDIKLIEYSYFDLEGIVHEDLVAQEIVTKDSLYRFLLSEIDSIAFVAPKPEISISPAYVPINWDETVLSEIDLDNYRFSIICNGEIPEIQPSSVITVYNNDAMHVVLVTEVQQDGNTLTIKGYPGDLSYLFFNTEFLVEGVDDEKSNSVKTRSTNNDEGKLTARIDWDYPVKVDFIEGGSTSSKASYIDFNTNFHLGLALKFRFGDKVETFFDTIKFLRSGYYDMDVSLSGGAKWNCDYTAEFNSEDTNIDLAPKSEDKYELIPNIKIPSARIVVPISALQIPIVIGGDFYKQVKLDVKNTHAKFTTGFEISGEGKIGYRYNGITGKDTGMYANWQFDNKRHGPTIEGSIETEAKFYIFPRIHAWICGVAGPSIDIKPYLRTNVTGGFRKDLIETKEDDYLAWSLTSAAGVDWALGWSIALSETFEVKNTTLFDGTFTKDDWILYKTPKLVQFNSVSNIGNENESLEVMFKVIDHSFLGDVTTTLPQVVKFECETGSVSGDMGCFSFAKDGIVNAKWKSGPASDVLYARIYDKDGNVLAEDRYPKELIIQPVIFYHSNEGRTYISGMPFMGQAKNDETLFIAGPHLPVPIVEK